MKHIIKHIFAAFGFTLQGIAAAFRSETAFRLEILALCPVAVLAFVLFSPAVALGLIAAWISVLALELLNTALESVSDLVSKDFHPLIKKAKDAGSASVFMGLVANGALWLAALLL